MGSNDRGHFVLNGIPMSIHIVTIFKTLHFVSVISEKTLEDDNLTKLPCDEGTVVYNNEPGPEKYVRAHYFKLCCSTCSLTTSVAAAKFISRIEYITGKRFLEKITGSFNQPQRRGQQQQQQ